VTTPSTVRHRFVLGARVARVWARLYTRGLDPDLRGRRRDELDADLWDQQTEAQRRGDTDALTSAMIVSRAIRGAFDDVCWRQEAARIGIPTRREPLMVVAPQYARWMAIAAMVGSALSAVLLLLELGNPGAWTRGPVGWIVTTLWVLGLVALYSLQRKSVGRVGRYGFGMLFAGYVLQFFAILVWWVYTTRSVAPPIFTAVIAISWLRTMLSVVGWVLVGIGVIRARSLPGQFVHLPLALAAFGAVQIAGSVASAIGVGQFSIAAALFLPGSSFRFAVSLAYAMAIAGLAYAVWSANRPKPASSAPAGGVTA
jgi:hypothetical protein